MNWEHLLASSAAEAAAAEPTLTNLQIGALIGLLLYAVSVGVVWTIRKKKERPAIFRVYLIYSALFFLGFVMALPFYWMIVTSVKSSSEATAYPPTWWPGEKHEEPLVVRAGASDREAVLQVLERFKATPESFEAFDSLGVARVYANRGELTRASRALAGAGFEPVPDPGSLGLPEPAGGVPSERFVWSNYTEAWKLGQEGQPDVTFTRYFYVSIVTSVISTAGALFTAIMAGFAFAKMRFFGSGLFFYIMLAMMMVPGQVLLVPSYVILYELGWLDTFLALIVPWTASMFAIFLLRQFMISVPDELWDAAQIDGATRFRFLWTIVVPLSVPALITTGIFLFLGNWNSLLWPLIVTSSEDMRTIQVGLQNFNQGAGTDFHLLMAASTIVIAPVIVLFFFAQRYFIEGITRSGIK